MKIIEKHLPEGRRLILFKIFYGILFSVICSFLIFRQVFEAEKYETKERIQGQRRILRPGARGDVFDREGKLLIGNKANFSAVIQLAELKNEIWEKKLALRNLSYEIKNELNSLNPLALPSIIETCFKYEFIKERKIQLSGKFVEDEGNRRTRVLYGGERLFVETRHPDHWFCSIDKEKEKALIQIFNSKKDIYLTIGGLFRISLQLDENGNILSANKNKAEDESFLSSFFTASKKDAMQHTFSNIGYAYEWEARLAVVRKYLDLVNKMTNRSKVISMTEVKKHWNRRLIMPLGLAEDLLPQEYAILVENLSPSSPIKVQANSIRHYPQKSLASHVLGYVGSGYESNSSGLTGSELATFEIKGRTGKAGIEKAFDEELRGKDGSDIWRVNPLGYRYERVKQSSSRKGNSINLSLDRDLQEVAELSLSKMISKVASNRVLPDTDWRKTIERRTKKALTGNRETEVSADLLISAFVDAPFALGGKEASTVAGFKGTEEDADRLLSILYSQGVLAKAKNEENKYFLAPPMLPPAAAVVLDLKTQEILALASKPNFNLQNLTPFISQSTYDEIQRREAWLPRAYHPGYAPASPFKLVTALACLRHSIIDPNELLLCEGKYRGMECHVFPGRHGDLSLKDAISQSCNVYFFRWAEKLGHEKLIQEAKVLGFDRNPVLELPNLRDKSIVPDPRWKKDKLGVNWTLEDTFNISIGQGGLRQSPLQMACFAAMLATRQSSFSPTIIKQQRELIRKEKTLNIPDSDYLAIIEGMQLATTQGTARRCKIEGISIAGKTGTGQWRNRNMELNLAWFIGFAPVEKPAIALAVLVEGVIPQDQIQGGLTATPVAREIISAYFTKYKDKLVSAVPN